MSEELCKEVAERGSGQHPGAFCPGLSSPFPPFATPQLKLTRKSDNEGRLWPLLQYTRSDQGTDTSKEYELTGLNNKIP